MSDPSAQLGGAACAPEGKIKRAATLDTMTVVRLTPKTMGLLLMSEYMVNLFRLENESKTPYRKRGRAAYTSRTSRVVNTTTKAPTSAEASERIYCRSARHRAASSR